MNMTDNFSQFSQYTVHAKPWVVKLARFGYIAKGTVYFLIGLLAFQAAFGWGGETTGMEGALQAIRRQPFGQVLLLLTTIGLFGYALWRFIQAWVDPDHDDSNEPKRIVQRIGYVISGLIYGGGGVESARMAMGALSSGSGDSGGNAADHWAARLMAQPFGPWLLGLVGLIIIGVGLYMMYRGLAATFREELKLHQMSETERTWAMRAGRLGYTARGIVYIIIGGFVIWAAVQLNPNAAVNTEGALETVARQPYGGWLLALMGLGLMAYAVFAFVEARYRNIEVE